MQSTEIEKWLVPPEKLVVDIDCSLREVMQKIDKEAYRMAVVIDKNKCLAGVVTDGNIRREILNGVDLDSPIKDIMIRDPIILHAPCNISENVLFFNLKQQLLQKEIQDKIRTRIKDYVYIPVIEQDSLRFIGAIRVNVIKNEINYELDLTEVKAPHLVENVCVIGGAGYIGIPLVNLLVERGYKVRVLDKFLWGKENVAKWINNKRIEVIEGDIKNSDDVIKAIRGMDAVCHLAAIVGDPSCNLDFKSTFATNYLSTVQIAEACKYFQVNRFIFASTCSVYGASLGDDLLTEESPLNPVSTYARTKLEAERILLKMADNNFAPVIFRKATVYGLAQRMRFDLAINLLTAKAFTDGEITIMGGDQWRPFIHVDDVALAYLNALETPVNIVRGQIYNVGITQENYRMSEIGEIIKEYLPETKIILDEKNIDKRNYRVRFDKIQTQLGFKTQWTVRKGIQQIISAFKKGQYKDWKDSKYNNARTFEEILQIGNE
ncbi:MAG: NAD-dependent epimerase/dehydratase family protein [Candidatus Sigynarchaeota archaeon]